MKFKSLIALCAAGACFSALAQSHVEGVEYFKADQFNNARELLERNYSQPATDKAVANYYLGLIALENKNPQQAAAYFEKGLAANPDYGFNYAGQGAVALLDGDAKEAARLFKLGEGKAKKDAAYQIAVAKAYYDANPAAYEKEIAKAVEKARKANEADPAIYLFEGDMRRDAKEIGGAASMYEMAASYNPQEAAAYVKYADLYTQVNPAYGIQMLRQLLQQNPNSALGQRELANAYYENKNYDKAAEQYGKYVANPNHFKQDEDRYAFLLFAHSEYQQGYDYATKLLEADPSNFNARRFQFINAAQIDALKPQLIGMADALLAEHRSNPANKFASVDYNLIASELSDAKRGEEAVELLNEAIVEQPENANYDKQLAMTFVSLNNLTEASKAYEGYLKKTDKPGYNDFIQQATFSYYAGIENRDNPELANVFYQKTAEYAGKAAEILPDNYKPKKFLGDIAKATASDETAMKSASQPYYEEAVVLLENSQDPSRYTTDAKEMYNYLGNYYLDHKDVAKAKEYFNKYLTLDPDNQSYRKFVDSLK